MIDLLYLALFYPLERALLWVLNTAYPATGAYGTAIILLSVVSNVALRPFYHMAERALDRQKAIRRRLAFKEEEFRSIFTGLERYFMLRTLYRQHGYDPAYALRSWLPLLLQVLFFIAAFDLLSDFSPLRGHSFLFLPDLGRPDELLGGLNLMPLLMTVAGLLSSVIYTRQCDRRDKTRMSIVALVFLIILYGAPSGVLLYWTASNLFLLIKNCVYVGVAAPIPAGAVR